MPGSGCRTVTSTTFLGQSGKSRHLHIERYPLRHLAAPSHPAYASDSYPTYTRSPPYQIYFKNQVPASGSAFPKHLPLQDVLSLVTDSFTSATERHIEVCVFSDLFFLQPIKSRSSMLSASSPWLLVAIWPPYICISPCRIKSLTYSLFSATFLALFAAATLP